jgi:LPXTG-site transpeptidase (sortase) family protein
MDTGKKIAITGLFLGILLVISVPIRYEYERRVHRNTMQEQEKDYTSEKLIADKKEAQKLIDDSLPIKKSNLVVPVIGAMIGRISIPSIIINKKPLSYPILYGATVDNLAKSISQLENTASIDSIGNTVLGGHNEADNSFFGLLPTLSKGSKVYLESIKGNKYSFIVIDMHVVEPSDMHDSASTSNKILTLFTCVNSGSQRLIVVCKLVG